MKITLDEFEQLFEKFIEQRPDRFVELLKRPNVQDALMRELEYRTGRRDFLKLGLVGLLATLGGLGVASMRSEAAIFHRQDGSYVKGLSIDDLPTIPRSKLEYPTEDVSFAYLACINKLQFLEDSVNYGGCIAVIDSFTDKGIEAIGASIFHLGYLRWNGGGDFYWGYLDASASTADFGLRKFSGGSETNLAIESVDLSSRIGYHTKIQISGSTISAYRTDMTTPKITATDTEFASGYFGIQAGRESYEAENSFSAKLVAPTSPAPKAKVIIEIDSIKQSLVEIGKLDNLPEFLYRDYKRYLILKNKGFTDEEIKLLFGDIQTHVDLASVTGGVFEHKPEHSTMIITITAGNFYSGEQAIQDQIDYAKGKGFKVLNPPSDYNEAIEQYRALRKDFPEWIAGKDNYAYQTLGHECFEHFAVADFYYGAIFDGMYGDNPFKNVPEWELQNTLAMWGVRLSRGEILKSTEKEQHMFKLRQCCKEYNVPEWRVAVRELIEFGTLKVALESAV